MNRQEALDRLAAEYDPAADKLVVLRPIRVGDDTLQPGDEFSPNDTFHVEALRRLIRTRHVQVLEREKAEEFACPQCDRTFQKKVNLGAHLRSHKE